jgi:H+/Cl- antiporter ClcA
MKLARRIFLSSASGAIAGSAATVFLYLLDFATKCRQAHPEIIWLLPLAGLLIGWIFHQFGRDILPGNNLVLDEIHDPKKVIPARMSVFILFGTILTHLFGGSAGREGTAVQMGASLSDQLGKYVKVSIEERKMLLVTGMGAGFGAAIGAPIAGAIFGMEVLFMGRLRLYVVMESLIASLFGYSVAVFLRAPHSVYPSVVIPALRFETVGAVVLLGVLCGVAAFVFVRIVHAIEKIQKRLIPRNEWKPFVGGLVLVALFQIPGSSVYEGLGIERIQSAMILPAMWWDPVCKAVFTAITIGSGFKGGEFIPLVFIGTTLGSVLGFALNLAFPLLAAVGFASVFGAAASTPLACAIMASELFGMGILPYAAIGTFVAYFCSGSKSIYARQPTDVKIWWLGQG